VNPHYLLYLSTKGAVEQMVRVLCKDLATKQITVNAVAPGPTDTPLFNKGMSEPGLTFVKNLIPRGRLGAPHEIAEVMAFFASDASGWVSGQVLRVNGGMA
jgi:3-oxoacyl-[acyl-carrier protein] reductase